MADSAIIVPSEVALWYPYTDDKSDVLLTPDVVCLHTMVGTLSGSFAWANQPGNPYWHFGVAGDGLAWQCRDLRYVTAANLRGNWHVIPIETADRNEGIWPKEWTDPLWTDEQMERLTLLVAWLCKRFNIPPFLIPDTVMPRRGIAYHRQGIEPWLVDGGEKWSNHDGKPCPARRVSQVDELITEVQKLVLPKPVPELLEDQDMVIVNPPGGSNFMFAGNRIFGLKSTADVANAKKAGIEEWVVSDSQWATIVATFPIVHAPNNVQFPPAFPNG